MKDMKIITNISLCVSIFCAIAYCLGIESGLVLCLLSVCLSHFVDSAYYFKAKEKQSALLHLLTGIIILIPTIRFNFF